MGAVRGVGRRRPRPVNGNLGVGGRREWGVVRAEGGGGRQGQPVALTSGQGQTPTLPPDVRCVYSCWSKRAGFLINKPLSAPRPGVSAPGCSWRLRPAPLPQPRVPNLDPAFLPAILPKYTSTQKEKHQQIFYFRE